MAGQFPPPFGGQNLMIQRTVEQFTKSERCRAVYLPFVFTPEIKSAQRGQPRKAYELIRVLGRLFRIRMRGPIDLLLYPTGGPQRVAMIRDLLLLPWVFLVSRRVVLHFHAAGIADELERKPAGLIATLLKFVYSKAFAAVVMTNFGRRDPEAVGIGRILVVPWRVADDFEPARIHRNQNGVVRLLHIGHLCADKGTPQLLKAFAEFSDRHPNVELELVGQCLPPFSSEQLENLIDALGIRSKVHVSGLLRGDDKKNAFGRADLFVFPTVAPYESFGLVLAEAMAWKLPIVASEWRGNHDVLTSDAKAVYCRVSPLYSQEIGVALEEAYRQRPSWTSWGETNRAIFEKRYRDSEDDESLLDALLSTLESRARRKRILYIHNSADLYGASRSLLRLLHGADRDRIHATVVLPQTGPLKDAIDALGITVLIDPTLAIVTRYTSWVSVLLYRFPVSVWKLARLIRKLDIDLVHTNTGVIVSPGIAAKIAGVPHIWHMRESFREGRPLLWKLYSAYIQMVSDRIVAVSHATAAQFSNRRKVVVVHNGFSVDEFVVAPERRHEFRQQLGIADSDLVTGCVGRIKWGRKGQEHLIQAAHLLKKRGIISKILIVGSPFPGNEIHLQRLQELARELSVENQVVFAGELADPKPAYTSMDIFVLPSAYPEPFGGVVMEAMCMALPVIATNLGGSLDQIVEGVTGFLVPPADPEHLAQRLEQLAKDPDLRRRMGIAGRERITREFALSEMVKKIETLYAEVLSKPGYRHEPEHESQTTSAATISS